MNSTPLTGTEYSDYKNHSTSQTTDSSSCDVTCIFYAVANVIVFILGVAGNGLVIWIAGFKVKKSVVSTWYLSLAMSDFIFCSFLPFSVVYMVKNEWLFGRFMCKFTSFIMWLNMFSSIFLLVIISVDRCVTVMFPVWAQNKRTGSWSYECKAQDLLLKNVSHQKSSGAEQLSFQRNILSLGLINYACQLRATLEFMPSSACLHTAQCNALHWPCIGGTTPTLDQSEPSERTD
ncbi:hypothetical protein AOLI_G00276770 [Acnodon oligacanthus]